METHVVILGEMHGTIEGTAFVESLVCSVLAEGKPVRLGLEAVANHSDSLNTLTQNSFSRDAVYAAAPTMWDSHDGRSSEAEYKLLEQIADWRLAGHAVDLFAFDRPYGRNIGLSRSEFMAKAVDEALADYDGTVLVYTGGAHSTLTREDLTPKRGSMANLVTERPVISLDMVYDAGEAYVQASVDGGDLMVGPLSLQGTNSYGLQPWSLSLEPLGVHYTGYYYVGPITASPPAFPADSEP
ncbi:MAG: hypothetical protein AAFZ91_11635 [Pseudomonadota bacterium]